MDSSAAMPKLQLFDTTLRDGAQMSSVCFSARDKIAIAKKLDELGIQYIEGGFPGSNEKEQEFFRLAREEQWQQAKICAFGSTHHKKYEPENDPNLNVILKTGAPVAVLFGKNSRFQATEIIQVTPEQNLEIIKNSVQYLTSKGMDVIYDAEHFFDGYVEDADYTIACIQAAEAGGAINLTLADTNGGMLPWQVTAAVEEVKKHIKTPLGIHTHNDSDLAVANTLAAVQAGVEMIQGTINGFGERCGNASLCSVIPNLQLKMGIKVVTDENLRKLTELSRFVQELSNINPRKDLPFVGRWAFCHKGGIHVSAMRKNPLSYQHIRPELVGNASSTSMSELSGRANIFDFLEKNGITADEEQALKLLEAMKKHENEGLTYDGGEASLEILAREIIEERPAPYHLNYFFVRTGLTLHAEKAVEATVRVEINGEEFHTAGLGNGPVNALDSAMRKALEPKFPQLKNVELVDYKVRIIDMSQGTSAKTRVQIETRAQNGNVWRTVGCSQNIIEASMQALSDAYVLAIWKGVIRVSS